MKIVKTATGCNLLCISTTKEEARERFVCSLMNKYEFQRKSKNGMVTFCSFNEIRGSLRPLNYRMIRTNTHFYTMHYCTILRKHIKLVVYTVMEIWVLLKLWFIFWLEFFSYHTQNCNSVTCFVLIIQLGILHDYASWKGFNTKDNNI